MRATELKVGSLYICNDQVLLKSVTDLIDIATGQRYNSLFCPYNLYPAAGELKGTWFQDLDEGACFIWNDKTIIKIEDLGFGLNCVELQSGIYWDLGPFTEVLPIRICYED